MSEPSERQKRRRPIQERAHRRREAILDATARLLDRVGFASTTTNAVAQEAGASIGTVYEYFPNKEALFIALLERYRLQLGEQLSGALQREATGWRDVIGNLFDVFVDFYRNQPGYRTLWLGSQLADILVEAGRSWGDEFAHELAPALGLLAPGLSEERRRAVTQVSLHLVSALVTAGLQAGGDRERVLIEEAKLALMRYLEPELE